MIEGRRKQDGQGKEIAGGGGQEGEEWVSEAGASKQVCVQAHLLQKVEPDEVVPRKCRTSVPEGVSDKHEY